MTRALKASLLGISSLLGLLAPGISNLRAQPIAPLPIRTSPGEPKLTCADFALSINTSTWSATHDIQLNGRPLKQGVTITPGLIDGVALYAVLQSRCAMRRPS